MILFLIVLVLSPPVKKSPIPEGGVSAQQWGKMSILAKSHWVDKMNNVSYHSQSWYTEEKNRSRRSYHTSYKHRRRFKHVR